MAAWAFGYRRGAIVHGMSAVHVALAALLRDAHPPDDGDAHLDVAFVRPVFRTAPLELVVTRRGHQVQFAVAEAGSGKELVVGALHFRPD